jgi:hypothetical protein
LAVVVVTVGSRPKRVETSGQLAEHCVETLRDDGETCPDQVGVFVFTDVKRAPCSSGPRPEGATIGRRTSVRS